jgi:hypothetical protein
MNKIYFILFFFSAILSAQEQKNQIYLNADDIIPALFNSSNSSYNLGYRRQIKENKHLRFGLKYFQESENEFSIGLKPGIDIAFSSSKKWIFYYGLDLAVNHTNNLQAERKYYEFALIPFFRAEYVISNSFSISTEPGLFIKTLIIKDVDESPIDNSNSIFSSGIAELGIININFSF